MKKVLIRLFSCILIFLLFVGSLTAFSSLRADAAETGVRFIFDSLYAAEDQRYPADGNSVYLTLNDASEFFAKEIKPLVAPGGTNAVYIALINRSAAETISFTYEYVAYTPQTKTVTASLAPHSNEVQTLILPTPFIENATNISLSFGVNAGSVEICSLFNISTHDRGVDQVITVESCRFDQQQNTVEISGSIPWEITVQYSNATLALFSIGPAENAYLSNKTPLARTGISFQFSFSVPVGKVEDLFYRYIIAAITETGERIPLTTPYYPTVTNTEPGMADAFKGVHMGGFENAVTVGAQTAIVDIYLDRLMGQQNGGVLYAGDRSYYYFDADYLAKTDTAIRNLCAAGVTVYLRFLISPTANDFSFVSYTESGENIAGKGILIQNEDALQTIYAITDFLTGRYADDSVGRISGLILGHNVNYAAKYNRTGSTGLKEETERYAAVFSLVSGVACRNIPGLSMIVPLFESYLGDTLDAGELSGLYPADLYLYTLLDTLKDYYLNAPAVNVCLSFETETTPKKGENRSEAFLAVTAKLRSKYSNLNGNVMFSWVPNPTAGDAELQDTYALLFVQMRLSAGVSSFFVNTAELPQKDALQVQNTLSYLLYYIDSQRHAEVLEPVLARLEIASLREFFPSYAPELFRRRKIYQMSLSAEGYEHGAPVGKFDLWNFDGSTHTQSWYSGNGCAELSVLSGNTGNLLTAKLDGGSDFSGIIHHFVYGEALNIAPYLRFEFGVNSNNKTLYEVQVQFLSANDRLTASAVLGGGDFGVYYLDLSEIAAGLGDVCCIRIAARPLDGNQDDFVLCLRSIAMESTEYNDNELNEKISAYINRNQGSEEEKQKRDYTTPIIVTIAVLIVSIAFTVILTIRYKNQKETDER